MGFPAGVAVQLARNSGKLSALHRAEGATISRRNHTIRDVGGDKDLELQRHLQMIRRLKKLQTLKTWTMTFSILEFVTSPCTESEGFCHHKGWQRVCEHERKGTGMPECTDLVVSSYCWNSD